MAKPTTTSTHTPPRGAQLATLATHRNYTNANLKPVYAKQIAPREEADGFDTEDETLRGDAKDPRRIGPSPLDRHSKVIVHRSR
jgi:hypothetical protein